MDESRFGKFSALKTTFPLNMSAMKRPKQKKNFVLQKPSEIQENKEKRTHTLNIVDEQAPSASRKKKRMSLVSKLSLGRFRGSTITKERHGPEGGNNSRSRSQSSSQESPVWFEKGEVVEQVEKGGILQRPRSTVTVVHRKSPSLTIGHAPQQKQLLHCSHSILSDPQFNTQVDLAQKSLLLEERRALFQHRESHPISSPDSGSDSNLDNSTRSVSVGCSEDNQDRKVNRTARHISVRKFDTFSTFEGTFDEDTGLGYLVGIEENRIESCEDTGMPATNDSQDSTTSQNHAVYATSIDKREHLYKILVIGELGTGKTSIIKRYVHQFFSQHYRATIGVDFALKVLNWDPQTIIRLQLWDIAGQERFGNMTRVYYKEAVGAFIVFDVTRSATLDAVVKWKQDLDSKVQLPDGSPIPCVLLANKCDQQKEGLVNFPSKMDEYCREKSFTSWFETSAKENINIEEAAKFLVTKILQNDQIMKDSDSQEQLDGEKFALDQCSASTKKSCTC